MNTIKAIETEYHGYRFRSRLEARWAVFFDSLQVEWLYEFNAFETTVGNYLPDFLLPKSRPAWWPLYPGEPEERMTASDGVYMEVKPTHPTDLEICKLRDVSLQETRGAVFLCGIETHPKQKNIVNPFNLTAWTGLVFCDDCQALHVFCDCQCVPHEVECPTCSQLLDPYSLKIKEAGDKAKSRRF